MIVDENDSRRSLRDCFPEDFARMYQRRVQKSARYSYVALETVLRIEHGDVKLLNRKVFEPLREDLKDIPRPAHRRSFLSLLRRHASPQLERGVDTNRTSRSYPADAG